jgi:hypothetical protein
MYVFSGRCVFTSPLVTASNGKHSPSSGFLNCPQPQLPASHSNSSQQLNPSGYLTHSPTNSLSLTKQLTQFTHSLLKSKLCYDWWWVSQFILVSITHLGPKTDFYSCQTVVGLLMWGTLTLTSAFFSWVRVPWELWPYFTVPDLKLHIYIP